MRVIIDFDGTLTAEEEQAGPLAERSLDSLADEIIGVAREQLASDYSATRSRLLLNPHQYWWEVNGLVASYCDEGAFILNTTTLQVLLRTNPVYESAVTRMFPDAEYDPVVDCTNYLFHRHTAELQPVFRPDAHDVIARLTARTATTPVVLTNSLGDKVRRHLDRIPPAAEVEVLGDTRQYDMDPGWAHQFSHPSLGMVQVWPVSGTRSLDLRRRVYYEALLKELGQDESLAVVADTLSLPGALPLMMGIPFLLLETPYTPEWCKQVVRDHPLGTLLGRLGDLPDAIVGLGDSG